MSHIFDTKKFKKLDSPERRKILPPDEILSLMPGNHESIIADVGCGIGYFSIPFSDKYQTVHAIDISDIMIKELKKRSTKDNLLPQLGDFNSLLENDSIDIFFTATVIHELPDLKSFTQDAVRKLKGGGHLIYLDFMKKESSFGPPVERRISSEMVASLFTSCNLSDLSVNFINDTFYLVSGKKPTDF